jgi:hypothetical protein
VRRSSALALLGSTLLGVPRRPEPRVLVRRVALAPRVVAPRAQRVLAAAALAVATATAVVLLGLLAGAVSDSRVAVSGPTSGPVSDPVVVQSGASATVTVTVGSEETVWEVAESVVPSATGPEVGALAERIIVDNGLSSVRVRPGQVLRVTAG